jgi:hypothetical protein
MTIISKLINILRCKIQKYFKEKQIALDDGVSKLFLED